jgi:hypothetical protein
LTRELQLKNKDKSPVEIYSCTMCKISFTKEDMTKTVTKKLILDLKTHINKRGIFWMKAFNPAFFTSCSKNDDYYPVCDICYNIIMAESELSIVEKKFAVMSSIPVDKEKCFNPAFSEE